MALPRLQRLHDAVGAWIEADRLIEELLAIGSALQLTLGQRSALAAGERDALHARLDAIDGQLVEVEKRFSASIGLASRQAVQLLAIASLVFAAAMSAGVLAYAGRVLRHAEHSRRQLAEANQRWTLATASDSMGLFEAPAPGDRLTLDGRAAALFGLQVGPDGRSMRLDELRSMLQAEDLQAMRDALGHAFATSTLLKLRLRVRLADGGLRHVEATGIVPDEGADGAARNAALLLVESQRAAMAVTIVDKLPAMPTMVQADAQRLKQVFVYLLSNACKYNRRGGRLILSHRIDGEHLLLAFEDEGEGLDAAELAALFQPFHRLHRHQSIEGTGLGHVIVTTLLAQMGGDVTVSSVPGLGSTFTVRMARAAAA